MKTISKLQLLTAAALALPCCRFLNAQEPSSQPAEQTLARVYNVADLIHQPTSYPLTPQSATPLFTAAPSQQPTEGGIDSVTKLLEGSVDSSSWKENGGVVGSIQTIGDRLLVTQTQQNHDAIAKVLSEIRNDPSLSSVVSLRVYWLTLSPEETATIYAARANSNSIAVVPDKLLTGSHLYCAAQTTCFSGQTVHIESGRQKTFVESLTPIVGTNAIGYQPGMNKALSGVRLQVMPQLSPDGAGSVVDIDSIVSESTIDPSSIKNLPTTAPADGSAGMTADRLNSVDQEFRTTVRLPLAKNVLVGGMTLEPAEGSQTPRQLYVAVNVEAVR